MNTACSWYGRAAKGLVLTALNLAMATPVLGQSWGKFSGPLPDRLPVNAYLLPKFEKLLPKGTNIITFKNPSHFEMVVQVRNGGRAAQFLLKGKYVQKIYLPNGEYTIFYRFLSDKIIHEGRSFLARDGEFFDDDGKPMENIRELAGPSVKKKGGMDGWDKKPGERNQHGLG